MAWVCQQNWLSDLDKDTVKTKTGQEAARQHNDWSLAKVKREYLHTRARQHRREQSRLTTRRKWWTWGETEAAGKKREVKRKEEGKILSKKKHCESTNFHFSEFVRKCVSLHARHLKDVFKAEKMDKFFKSISVGSVQLSLDVKLQLQFGMP